MIVASLAFFVLSLLALTTTLFLAKKWRILSAKEEPAAAGLVVGHAKDGKSWCPIILGPDGNNYTIRTIVELDGILRAWSNNQRGEAEKWKALAEIEAADKHRILNDKQALVLQREILANAAASARARLQDNLDGRGSKIVDLATVDLLERAIEQTGSRGAEDAPWATLLKDDAHA